MYKVAELSIRGDTSRVRINCRNVSLIHCEVYMYSCSSYTIFSTKLYHFCVSGLVTIYAELSSGEKGQSVPGFLYSQSEVHVLYIVSVDLYNIYGTCDYSSVMKSSPAVSQLLNH